MRRHLAFSLLVLTSTTLQAETITLMSFNVENLFDTTHDEGKSDEDFLPDGRYEWTEAKLANKRANLADIVLAVKGMKNQLCPDVLGLAEVENRRVLLNWMNNELKECQYTTLVSSDDDPDERGIQTAIMTRLETFTKPKFYSPYRGGRYITEIGITVNEVPLMVFMNHWKSRLPERGDNSKIGGIEKRKMSAQMLKKRVNQILEAYPTMDMAVIGDFNDETINDSLKKYLGVTTSIRSILEATHSQFWDSAYDLFANEEFKQAYENLETAKQKNEFFRKARGTFYYSRENIFNSFDNILINQNLFDDRAFQLETNSFRVIRHKKHTDKKGAPLPFPKFLTPDEGELFSGASDHFAVVLKLKVAD